MKRSIIIEFLLLVIFPGFVFSQEIEKKDPLEMGNYQSGSYLRAGLNFTNDWVFVGRKDSIAVPYLTPSLSYYHKSGLYAAASISYLAKSDQQKIDMYKLSGGYFFQKKNLFAGVNGSAMFFNDSSYSVQSEVGGSINVYSGYDFTIAELTLDASILLSGSADIISSAELSKAVYALHDNLLIWPSLYAIAGTQYYYSEYYKYRRSGMGRMHNQGGNGQTSLNSVSLSESGKFKILAYEFSVPVHYNIKDFRISITPTYAIPVNPSTITIDGTSSNEDIENVFYWSAGTSYKF